MPYIHLIYILYQGIVSFQEVPLSLEYIYKQNVFCAKKGNSVNLWKHGFYNLFVKKLPR